MTNDDLTVFRERNARKRLSNAAALIGKADDAVFEACRPTGYAELDRCLGGGLTAGLHCLGAVPSLGKSTYVMQMAEQMAAEGTHVIVISLEMKPVDLAAKAVSRQLYTDWHETSAGLLKTSGELRSRTAVIKLTGREWMAVEEAAGKVEKRSRTITVEECGAKGMDCGGHRTVCGKIHIRIWGYPGGHRGLPADPCRAGRKGQPYRQAGSG